MSSRTQDDQLCKRLMYSIIPELTFDSHKGSLGGVLTIGGSRDYTGAPYFASISSLKLGADMAYVVCHKDAAQPIKSYSPELMTFPVIDSISEIKAILPRVRSVVFGCGLGRDESFTEQFFAIIRAIREANLPIILDADGLYFVNKCPDIIAGYEKAILTPNAVEFKRLFEKCFNSDKIDTDLTDLIDATKRLSKALGGVTIVRKGREDIISNASLSVVCSEENSPRRCGGQGDILSGFIGSFNYWAHRSLQTRSPNLDKEAKFPPTMIAALAACSLTRRCNKLAFAKYGRNMTTSDMIKQIHVAFKQLFPVD